MTNKNVELVLSKDLIFRGHTLVTQLMSFKSIKGAKKNADSVLFAMFGDDGGVTPNRITLDGMKAYFGKHGKIENMTLF